MPGYEGIPLLIPGYYYEWAQPIYIGYDGRLCEYEYIYIYIYIVWGTMKKGTRVNSEKLIRCFI